VTLGGHEYLVTRAHLGQYLLLEQIRRSQPLTANSVRDYLTTCGLPTDDGSGIELLRAYVALIHLNQIVAEYPAFGERAANGKERKDPWDYSTRWVFTWVHTLAKTYHWSREEILGLDLDEAAGYIQEIVLSNQLDAEWEYQLSPNAYSYDQASKSMKFRPMTRPLWMQPKLPQVKQIPNKLRPQGNVIRIR
jgi:hypothetical protein